jgi:hypothetical protein
LEDKKMKKFSVLLIVIMAVSLTGTAQAHWNATNLLLNPGFEDPDPNTKILEPNEWVFDYAGPDAQTATVYKHDGGHTDANYIETDAYTTSSAGAWAVAYQTHYIAENRRYRIEAYAEALDGNGDKAEFKLDYKDSSGAIMDSNAIQFTVPLTDPPWALYTFDGRVAPIGARQVSAVVSSSSLAAGDPVSYIKWDDVKLTMIGGAPTPCETVQFNWGWDFAASDLNRDCVVDFTDYAIFAKYWLECNSYPYTLTCNYINAKHK